MLRVYKILIVFSFLLFTGLIGEAQSVQSYVKPKRHALSTNSHNEIAPVVTREGLVFQSDIPIGSYSRYQNANTLKPFLHIYIARNDENGGLRSQELLSEQISNIRSHDFSASFNVNEDFMAFNKNFEDNSNKGNQMTGIFFAENIDGVWTDIKEYEYNDREWMTVNPSLNASGSIMYFSSNRPGGFGGYDLYITELKNGNWSDPKNLGPVVNTSNDEIYPYLHSSGRLYFSSDGHDQFGGFDIFYSEFFNNRWFSPVKLIAPFNSAADDFTFFADENFETGFFTTNRRGTTDIYEFESTLPKFDVSKRQIVNNYCYVFYEENTMILDTAIYQYQWDLGDNARSFGLEAEHCYKNPGDYLVQLNVIDKLTGIVEFNQAEYMVEVRKIVQPYITAPDTVKINEQFQLHGLESYFDQIKPGEYYWDFGDGNKSVGVTARHTYLVPGNYQIKLGMVEEDNRDSETTQKFSTYKPIVVIE